MNITIAGSWAESAACATTDPDLFFPEQGHSSRPALRICETCPVLYQCRAYGDRVEQTIADVNGILGGETPNARLTRRRKTLATFTVAEHSAYPKPCTSCGRLIVRGHTRATEHLEGLSYGGHGMCCTCYTAWKTDGRPEPADAYRHTPATTPLSASHWPAPCTSCHRMIQRGHAQPGTGLEHGGHGLCKPCYTAWLRIPTSVRPAIYAFHYTPTTRDTYPRTCTSCHRTITRPPRTPGTGLAYGSKGMCSTCYEHYRRLPTKHRPAAENYHYQPLPRKGGIR